MAHKGRCYSPRPRKACQAAERAHRHVCGRIVEAMQALPCATPLTDDDARRIADVFRAHGGGLSHFRLLDEKPGYFPGYCDGGPEWHWKLRQCRNRFSSFLFTALTEG